MRKIILIILVFFGILITGFFVYQKNWRSDDIQMPTQTQTNPETNQSQQIKLNKESCNKDEDCALASNLPNKTGACVNKNWLEEWNKNPESEKYARDCMVGPICSGPKFVAGGMRMPKNNCQCVNNRCQIADLTNYLGCQMVGCD